MRPTGGRPSILDDTPELQKKRERFFRLLRAGVSVKTAAGGAKLGRSTVQEALAKGRKQRRGPYRDFLDRVIEAQDSGVAMLHLKVAQASPLLALQLLRAIRPEEYNPEVTRKQQASVEHTGKDGGPIQHAAAVTFYIPDNGRDGRDPKSDKAA